MDQILTQFSGRTEWELSGRISWEIPVRFSSIKPWRNFSAFSETSHGWNHEEVPMKITRRITKKTDIATPFEIYVGFAGNIFLGMSFKALQLTFEKFVILEEFLFVKFLREFSRTDSGGIHESILDETSE